MFCEKCGCENEEGAKFCRNCGARLDAPQGVQPQSSDAPGYQGFSSKVWVETPNSFSSYEQNNGEWQREARPQGYVGQAQTYYHITQDQIPGEYKPISAWGYFGYELLFCIPIVGFILVIVFAVSAGNKNLKNFARSYFCLMIIVIVIAIILCFPAIYSAVTGNSWHL